MMRPLPTILLLMTFASAAAAQDEHHYNHGELVWRSIETEHFFVHYHDGAERTARAIAAVAEDIYGPVTSLYGHEPEQKVNFIIKDYDDYSNGAAYFYDNKIEIWAPALDFDLRGTHHWLRNVITHEFTHIVQIQTSMKFGRRFPGFYLQWLNYEEERRQDVLYGYPNTVVSYPLSGFVIPSWFAEGVAQYNRPQLSYDFWDSHRDMILRMYALDSSMLSWNEMSHFGKTSLGNESSYNAGFHLTRYISRTYGHDAIPAISRALAGPAIVTIDQAIEQVIGKSGQALYDEWRDSVTADYRRRVEPVLRNRVEGERIAEEGFGNFHPVFSPDGTKIAYTSNKNADYFGVSSLYVYDTGTRTERKVAADVRSSLSWSPDGRKIYFSRITHDNPNGSQLSDLFVVATGGDSEGVEERLTHGLRAHNPSVSFDGTRLVFVVSRDGTTNIAVCDTLGGTVREVTSFRSGEQVYTPRWSPYGRTVVFGQSVSDGQDIMGADVESGRTWSIMQTEADERHPFYARDGRYIFFTSDVYGIPNIFRYDAYRQTSEQLTNVLGGAFMPSVNADGDIVYASYTSTGYKVDLLRSAEPLETYDNHYAGSERVRRPELDTTIAAAGSTAWDWKALRAYDPAALNAGESTTYRNIFSSVAVIPFLRIDNYNTKSAGMDFLKPGLYFTSSDMIEKSSMFGGAALNHKLERDLFVIFEYRDRVIGFHQLGLSPTFSLELYNITRKSTGDLELGLSRYTLDVTYSLLEFDLYIKQHLFSELDVLTLGFTLSRYSTDIGSFLIPGDATNPPQNVPGSTESYFRGTDLSLQWNVQAIVPSRTREINPVGASLALRYDYEMNQFNATGEYDATETGFQPRMTPFNFHKIELRYTHHFALPWGRHTLSFTGRGGTIFGPPVPDFFDFYAGGLPGMKGYPFYAIGGNELATLNAAYRFPIWENIDVRFLQFYFDRLYGEFHADAGNAWTTGTTLRDVKKDAGFEVRLEAFSWYAYPTRVFFNGTYGLDGFTLTKNGSTVSYGKEWRFYFGILFGFDFSNDIKRMMRDPHED